jgi:7-keto-8-aminopelargonate synthetase-like enzyme
VIGERSTAERTPYGARGNSVIRHVGENDDNVILVAGFSKAYSSLLAFLTLPTELKDYCKVNAAPYLYSGPSPTASLATVLAGFKVNTTLGDAIRTDLHRKTARVLAAVHHLELDTPNRSGLPIIEIPLGRGEDIDDVGRYLYRRGIYVTLATYPLVPRSEVGIRIQLTAANTDQEIDHLIDVLRDLTAQFPMRQPGTDNARPAFRGIRGGAVSGAGVVDDLPGATVKRTVVRNGTTDIEW